MGLGVNRRLVRSFGQEPQVQAGAVTKNEGCEGGGQRVARGKGPVIQE